MAYPVQRRLLAGGVLGFVLAWGVAAASPSAFAFDFAAGYSPGHVPDVCFSGSHWNDTKRGEAASAVSTWNTAVVNLGMNVHTDPNYTCLAADHLVMSWVDVLAGGAFAETDWGANAGWIVFALNDKYGNPFAWSFTDTPAYNPPDFRAVAVHELGHSIGLKHPESNGDYAYKSWDGDVPTMAASQPDEHNAPGRTLEQDDIAGGYWTKSRQWVAYPEMGSTAIQFWFDANGTLSSCASSYACLSSGPSNTRYRIRFTVDGRGDRSTPDIAVTWERATGVTGTMQVTIRTRNVQADGTFGAWDVIAGPTCSGSASAWTTCGFSPNFPATQVRDIQLVIWNQTDGMIKIARVEAVDG